MDPSPFLASLSPSGQALPPTLPPPAFKKAEINLHQPVTALCVWTHELVRERALRAPSPHPCTADALGGRPEGGSLRAHHATLPAQCMQKDGIEDRIVESCPWDDYKRWVDDQVLGVKRRPSSRSRLPRLSPPKEIRSASQALWRKVRNLFVREERQIPAGASELLPLKRRCRKKRRPSRHLLEQRSRSERLLHDIEHLASLLKPYAEVARRKSKARLAPASPSSSSDDEQPDAQVRSECSRTHERMHRRPPPPS